jgi:uncharacterized protein (DUF433 family)
MDMADTATSHWKHLAPKPGSSYLQLFVKGTRISARLLYGLHVNEEEPMTLEELAAAYNLPREAVSEAIAYCQTNPPEIDADWQREELHVKARAAGEMVRGVTP